jgi:hypothetical protein
MKTIKHLLFFFGLWIASLSYGQNNKVYDLNDPRNPSCPCHKIQKLAEDQYLRQIKESKTPANIRINNRDKKKQISDGVGKFLGKSLKKIQNRKFNISRKKQLRKKVRSDYSVCFKW